MEKKATISECGRYRYSLSRAWHSDCGAKGVLWVMLNPSVADAELDDPTVRRVVSFSRSWGYGYCVVVNLFAYRATHPEDLRRAPKPVGPDNDHEIRKCVGGCALVVAAWGTHGGLHGRDRQVLRTLRGMGVKVWCLGKTSGGHPQHPLYVPADRPPQVYHDYTKHGRKRDVE